MFIGAESRKTMQGYSWSRQDFRELLISKYFTMPEELENGCLGVGEQDTDYMLCNGFEDNLPTLYQQDDIIFEYNQNNQAWSKKSCTIFSAIGAISDLFNYEFTLAEIKEIDDISYTWGRIKNSGWWVQSAVKLVADRWNEHKANLGKVAYYIVDDTNDELVKKVIDKGYTIMTNIYGNGKYQMDYLRDAVLNGTTFGTSTYGHALNVRKVNDKRSVKDSYKGRKCNDGKKDCNIYELEHQLREIDAFGTRGYIYTKVAEDALEEVKRLNKMKTLTENMIRDNSEMWTLTNDAHYRTKLHDMNEINRKKVSDIENQLKKYL